MKLLADLHISPKTVDVLRNAGYAVSRITDHLPPTATDSQIIDLAERLQSVIVTQDLDYSRLIAKSGQSFPSVLSLRVGNVSHEHVTELLLRLLPTIESELDQGAIISADDAGLRVRRLPISSD